MPKNADDLGFPHLPILETHARRFGRQMLRPTGRGSARATLGAVYAAYRRWCTIEGNRPLPRAWILMALRHQLAACSDGVVILAGGGLWPDALQGCA